MAGNPRAGHDLVEILALVQQHPVEGGAIQSLVITLRGGVVSRRG
jgi:hypothetical protein